MINHFALERSFELLVFDAIEHADEAGTAEDLTRMFEPACDKLGFNHIGAFSVREPDGQMVGGYQAGTTDPLWADHYVAQEHFRHDAIVKMLPTSLDVMIWSDLIGRNEVEGASKRIFEEAGEFGLGDGFVLPQHYLNGAVAASIMTSPRAIERSKRSRAAAHILTAYYGMSVRRLMAPMSSSAGVRLSPRQRECLQWVRAGKSDWEIGEILKISEHTVKEHIEAARTKLGVRTRTQAVIEAIALRLISL